MSAVANGAVSSRLARLEQIVSRLQGQAGGGEQLSPNYLTVDPQGRVGANFTGLINALGLILPTALTGFQPPTVANNQIVWQDSGNGALVANIQGFANDAGNTSGVNVGSKAETTTWQNYASLNASSHAAASASASLQISQQNEGATGPTGAIGGWTEVDVFVGAISAMIMDAAGRSSFVQAGPRPSIPASLGLQAGENVVNLSAGVFTSFLLPSAWPNAHLAFVAACTPGASAAAGFGSAVVDTAHGHFFSTAGGNYVIDWISIGS